MKNKIIKSKFVVILSVVLLVSLSAILYSVNLGSSSPEEKVSKPEFKFSEFKNRFYVASNSMDDSEVEKAKIKASEFESAAQEFIEISKKDLIEKTNFIDQKPLDYLYFDLNKPFKDSELLDTIDRLFFVQKMLMKPDCELCIRADIHGDADSLIKYIDKLILEEYFLDDSLKIKKSNFYFIFLGDYVDRGKNSVEVLYLLMQLKLANPETVILLRGNHDNVKMNTATEAHGGSYDGCKKEFDELLGELKSGQIRRAIYNMFPSLVFIGVPGKGSETCYALFTHGGFEPRFNPHPLLSHDINSTKKDNLFVFQIINPLDNSSFNFSWIENADKNLLEQFKNDKEVWSYYEKSFVNNPYLGFENVDFELTDLKSIAKGQRGIRFGKKATLDLLKNYESKNVSENKKYSVEIILRGHQHAGMREMLNKNSGIYNSWRKGDKNELDGHDGLKLSKEFPVWTIDVSPYKKNVGTNVFAILKMKEGGFDNWTLKKFDVPSE